MKSSWIVIAGLVCMAAIAAWWMIPKGTNPGVIAGPVISEELPALTAGSVAVDGALEAAAESDATVEFARRLTHIPDTRQARQENAPSTDESDITAENIDHLVQANLEHALEGDIASGYFVTRARMNCDRFASTPVDLEQAKLWYQKSADQGYQVAKKELCTLEPGCTPTIAKSNYTNRSNNSSGSGEDLAGVAAIVTCMFIPVIQYICGAALMGGI